MKSKTIGWIGTGLMGNPMAQHLVRAGYTLNVHNRTKEKASELIAMGCIWRDTPAEIAANSDVVITMIGYPKDVEEVYFGADGIFKNVNQGMILVDMTTTKPSLAVRIFEESAKMGASFIDAPVSGGEIGAINGTLSVMIGGDKDAVQQVMPLFNVFAGNCVYQGAEGAGQHAKMCNQITIAGTMIGVCESLVYAVKAGLDLPTVLSSITKGAAACWTLDVLAPKIVDGDFAPGFMVNHFVKDLGIALEEAASMSLTLPGLTLARQLYTSLVEIGDGQQGTQSLYKVIAGLSKMT